MSPSNFSKPIFIVVWLAMTISKQWLKCNLSSYLFSALIREQPFRRVYRDAVVNTRSHTSVCDPRRQVEQLFKQQASYRLFMLF